MPKIRNWETHFKRVSKREKFVADFGAETDDSVIKQVQQKLNELGANPPLSVDGNAGPMTKAAVTAFQQANGLTVDGIIGPQVLKTLGIKTESATDVLIRVASQAISGIQQSVVDAFSSFNTKIEGYTPYMYTDSKGLVTTGIGNLIDDGSPNPAMSLPWKKPDGSLASNQEISDAWYTVKNAWPGVQSTASQSLTNLRLDKQGIAKLVTSKMSANHNVLRAQYPGYVNWPADAQLALHSLAWAWGPAFANVWGLNGIAFKAAVNQQKPDFNRAAAIMKNASAHEEKINHGLIPRNDANEKLFENAAIVQSKKGDYSQLWYPSAAVIAAGISGVFLAIGGGVLGVFGWKNYKKTGKVFPW